MLLSYSSEKFIIIVFVVKLYHRHTHRESERECVRDIWLRSACLGKQIPQIQAWARFEPTTWCSNHSPFQTPRERKINEDWIIHNKLLIFILLKGFILTTHPCPFMLRLKQPSLSHPKESAPHLLIKHIDRT